MLLSVEFKDEQIRGIVEQLTVKLREVDMLALQLKSALVLEVKEKPSDG